MGFESDANRKKEKRSDRKGPVLRSVLNSLGLVTNR